MQTINIGASRTIKNPDQIPDTAHDTTYLIDPGQYNVSIRQVHWDNVILQSADPHVQAHLCNSQNHEYGIFQAWRGPITLRNLTFSFSGTKGVVAMSGAKASVTLDGIGQNTGCLLWSQGGKDHRITNCWSTGKPWKYYICNFTSPLDSMYIDFSMVPEAFNTIHQGDNESALRVMQCGSLYAKGLIFAAALDKTGNYIKQEIAIRSGGKFCFEDCSAHQAALGWMDDPNIAKPTTPIQLVQFIGGCYTKWPVLGPSLSRVSYSKTMMAGFSCTKATDYPA